MADAGIKIIRRSSFTAVPWKNGGGVTHEAIRVPPTGDAFLWRVSVAQIDTSGPFSDFAGYDRKMVLLRGRGVVLEFATGERCALRSIGDWLEFDGAMSTRCELLDEAVRGSEPHDIAIPAQRGAHRAPAAAS